LVRSIAKGKLHTLKFYKYYCIYPKIKSKTTEGILAFVRDDSDDPTALGYHDYADERMPLGKIFVNTDQSSWIWTAGHELIENSGKWKSGSDNRSL